MNKTIHSEPGRLLTHWLRTCRKEKGLSMRALAARLHVPHSWIGKIEQGERRLDVVEYIRMCLALDRDPRDGIDLLTEAFPPGGTVLPASHSTPLRVAEKRATYTSPRPAARLRKHPEKGTGHQ